MTEPAQTTPPPPAGGARPDSRLARLAAHPAFISLLLAAATLAVFYPVARHDFVSYDDGDYVTANSHVQGGLTRAGMVWAFRTGHEGNWHPLTWFSHMLDVQLYGLNPAGHHLTSLLFHAANAVLLFLVLRRLTGAVWRSAFVAALFALHPLHVESVAWIAERKDVLSAFFFMLTLLAYSRYAEVRSPKSEVRRAKSKGQSPWSIFHPPSSILYLLSLAFFALGLMCKPMLVTLPFILLLLDYWPLRRLSLPSLHPSGTPLLRLVLEKSPFFALALASSIVTFGVQQATGAVESLARLSLGSRIVNALAAYSAYLGKTLWPMNLSVFYPRLPVPPWQVVASALLLACLTVLCVRQERSKPYLLVGWLWFCVMLLPVIGLVQVGSQAMADRYTYLPLIGVFIMLAWGAAEFLPRFRVWRLSPTLGALLLLYACLVGARFQLKHWRNTTALFTRALEVAPRNSLAHHALGATLAAQGNVAEAVGHYLAALEIDPAYDAVHVNLGCILAEQGKRQEAKNHFQEVLGRNPRHARACRCLGNVLFAEGDFAEALSQYELAWQIQPDAGLTAEALAMLSPQEEVSPKALPYLRQALDLLPAADLRAQVAGAWAGQGKFPAAVQGYRAALALQPQSPEILNNLAWLLATCPEADVRDGAEAVRLGERACELTRFKRTVMVGTLAAAYAEAGRFAEAVATAQKAGALAVESGDEALAAKNQALLELYRAGRPYHEAAYPAPAGPASPNP